MTHGSVITVGLRISAVERAVVEVSSSRAKHIPWPTLARRDAVRSKIPPTFLIVAGAETIGSRAQLHRQLSLFREHDVVGPWGSIPNVRQKLTELLVFALGPALYILGVNLEGKDGQRVLVLKGKSVPEYDIPVISYELIRVHERRRGQFACLHIEPHLEYF